VTINTVSVRAFATALMLGLVATAQSESLDIKPGLWKKTTKMETGGRTVMETTIDACMTSDDLDLNKTAQKMAQSPSCRVAQQELTPKRVKIVLQCKEMLVESTTEVRSRESVVVTATMKPTGSSEVTRTSESWTFLKAGCTKK
jgi:Protein of unknown function (DUF3617)